MKCTIIISSEINENDYTKYYMRECLGVIFICKDHILVYNLNENILDDFEDFNDFEDFKDIYLYAYEKGLKGCTTFRFNPEAFQGVLVTEKDLENTTYQFSLEDGSSVEVKGNEEVEYDGETHTAANLFDALKEGYYGKF